MPDATDPSYDETGPVRPRLVALPGLRAHRPPRSNLPAQLSSFVGRERELTEIAQLLRKHRLVSLTGPGGAGKTRLALVAAGELVEVFDDGVWLVELAPLAEPASVAQTVATVLDVREQPGRPLARVLSDYLATRRLLLVLDNCEHLIDASAVLVESLLRGCPDLHVLATSREALSVDGESAWPVPALTLASEAMNLFADRATAVDPGFTLTDETAPAVAAICTRLDGMPLAIELAAARTRMLTVQEIADGLDDCFSLLAKGPRTADSRHRSLYAAIDWSHDLLARQEQVLFRRLAVFAGGLTAPAAEQVCAGAGLERRELFGLLSHLVDKSLVATRAEGGASRYRLQEVVWQYAHQALVRSEDWTTSAAQHATYFLAFAEQASLAMDGPDQASWLARLEVDHDNLRAALAWSRDHDPQLGVRLAAALTEFWFIRGYLSEGQRWLEDMIAAAPAADSTKAKALIGAALLATYQDYYDEAERLAAAGLALYRERSDTDGIAAALVTLSSIALAGQRSHLPFAELLAEGLALRSRLSNPRTVAQLLDLEGAQAAVAGQLDRATARWEESLALSRAVGNAYVSAFTLSNLGLLAVAVGDHEQATDRLAEGLRLSLALDYKLIMQFCLIGFGKINAAAGRLGRAARLWGAADSMSEAYGTHMSRAARQVVSYEDSVAAARAQLGEPTWSEAWSDGRAMTREQAAAYAMDAAADDPARPVAHPQGLSDREVEVLALVANGLTSAEVAKRVFLSVRTVDWHLASVYTKLGVRSRTEATRFAVDHHLV